jgi:Leucine-rich repeat (LRR) protein
MLWWLVALLLLATALVYIGDTYPEYAAVRTLEANGLEVMVYSDTLYPHSWTNQDRDHRVNYFDLVFHTPWIASERPWLDAKCNSVEVAKAATALPHLTNIHFHDSSITADAAAIFAATNRIESLSLGGSVDNKCLKELSKMTKLRSLHLKQPLTHEQLQDLQSLTRLEELSFSGMVEGEEASLNLLAALPNLKRLWISSDTFTSMSLAPLTAMPKLECLELQTDNLESLDNLSPDTLRQLVVIDIMSSKLTSDGLSSLAHAEQLQYLSVSSPEIDDRIFPIVARLPHLESLSVGGGKLTLNGATHLLGKTSLKSINIGSPQFSDADYQRLYAMFPDLR